MQTAGTRRDVFDARIAATTETRSSHSVEPGLAQLSGWLVLAAVNAVFIVTRVESTAAWPVQLTYHLYAAGQLLGLGLLVAGAVEAWRRWGSKRRSLAYAALTLMALGVGLLTVPPDLDNFISRSELPAVPVVALFVTIAAAAVVGAAVVGGLLARPYLRWLAAFVLVGAGVINNVMLRNDYDGAHLFLAWTSTTLFGAAITGATLPRALVVMGARVGRVPQLKRVVLALLAGIAVLTLVRWPPTEVVVALHRLDGAVATPFLARLRATLESQRSVVASTSADPAFNRWLTPRHNTAPISPPAVALLPKDAILVLITIDAVRYELLVDEQYRSQLPELWELADRSLTFTAARAPGSSTRNTLGSLFTGKLRSQLNWTSPKRLGSSLREDNTPRFTDVLRDAGVPTFMSVAYKPLLNSYGVITGFDEDMFVAPPPGQKFALADAMLEALIDRMRRHTSGPLFLFAHLMDPHEPYDSAGTQGSAFERYVREVASCGKAIQKLWQAAAHQGLVDRLVLIIASDHGEAFGQHGTPFHGKTLYEELVRVPLLIRLPGVPPRRIHDTVSLLDIGPTVLDLMRLNTPGHNMGQSLVPLLAGARMSRTHPIAGDTGAIQYLLNGKYKLIRDQRQQTREIYDLTEDPGELKTLTESLPDAEAQLGLLDAFFAARREEHPTRAPR